MTGLYFPLSSNGDCCIINWCWKCQRKMFAMKLFWEIFLCAFFFRALQWPVFFLSGLYLTLKTVKGRCSSLLVLEDFHWSDHFSSPWPPGWLPPPSWDCIFTGPADPAIALQVIDCCFSNNKAFSLGFYYLQTIFRFLKELCTFQVFWPDVGRRLLILETNWGYARKWTNSSIN